MGTASHSVTSVTGQEDRPVLAKFVQKFQADLKAIQVKSQVTPAQQQALFFDLRADAKAATTKPDATAEATAQDDFKAILAGGPIDFTRLEGDEAAVLTSEGVPQ